MVNSQDRLVYVVVDYIQAVTGQSVLGVFGDKRDALVCQEHLISEGQDSIDIEEHFIS